MTSVQTDLKKKLEEHKATIAVLGLGYVGLPLAVVFAEAGFKVIGIDPDQSKVDVINKGETYISDVEEAQLARLVKDGMLRASADFAELANADAVSICVPTPLRKTGDPDLSFIVSASEQLAEYLHSGMVIVLESTTYPGTTRELVLSSLTEKSDLKVGEDFFLAFSPERVDPGREDWTTINMPKVIGGITEACGNVASHWYAQALEAVVPVSSTEVAEMAKLLENTFRMVNVGLVNEMAVMCDRLGIDVWEVIDAAATKPFGFMKFTPGPGLGGHCIPIDPLYLSWKLKSLNYNARFIELASEINTNMPRYVVDRALEALNEHSKPLNGSKVLVLGAAYKPDIDDLRESPALDVIGLLREMKATVEYHDPFIPHIDHEDWNMHSVSDYEQSAKDADLVIVVTNHSDYDYPAILKQSKLILDTRNAFGKIANGDPKVMKL
jgi:UDP-N-acetyl-D-glucosamine dehydrogenase